MRKERKIINTNIRLNLCDEQDRQAWEYLQTMDREKYKSYTRAVVVALNDYFSREYRNEADPYLETREKKQKEAEKKARTIEYQFNKAQEEVKIVKKKTDCEIKKLKNEAKEKETFWMMAYMILVLLAVIKNTVFQKDLFACITVPLSFCYRYIEWLIHPSELNILGEQEYFQQDGRGF